MKAATGRGSQIFEAVEEVLDQIEAWQVAPIKVVETTLDLLS